MSNWFLDCRSTIFQNISCLFPISNNYMIFTVLTISLYFNCFGFFLSSYSVWRQLSAPNNCYNISISIHIFNNKHDQSLYSKLLKNFILVAVKISYLCCFHPNYHRIKIQKFTVCMRLINPYLQQRLIISWSNLHNFRLAVDVIKPLTEKW